MLSVLRDNYNRLAGKKEALNTRLLSTDKLIEQLSARSGLIDKAQVVLQLTAKETQEKLKFHIEDLVQSALDSCFPGKYDFQVEFEIKRGKTEARLFLDAGDGCEINPLDSSGGGVIDIISFALRLAAWTLSKTDNVLLFDEPFKLLSVDIRPYAVELLKQLSDKLKLQLIIITHDSLIEGAADKIFKIDQKKGRSFIV